MWNEVIVDIGYFPVAPKREEELEDLEGSFHLLIRQRVGGLVENRRKPVEDKEKGKQKNEMPRVSPGALVALWAGSPSFGDSGTTGPCGTKCCTLRPPTWEKNTNPCNKCQLTSKARVPSG